MTSETTTAAEPSVQPRTTASGRLRGNPWHPTFRGVALATWIELLRRRPSKRGYIAYAAIFAGILALTILAALSAGPDKSSVPLELVLVLILGAGMLIGPSLSATSINGDSSEGVLAPLQMTRLTASDLALGKLLASWAVCIAALLTTTPFLIYGFLRSGWSANYLVTMLAVAIFVVLAFTAVGLAWSSIAARAVASVALTHLTTGLFVLGTLLLFVFTMPLVSEDITVVNKDFAYDQMTEEQMNDPNFDPSVLPCVEISSTYTIAHTQQTAWMLLINPAVVIAETAPLVNPNTWQDEGLAAPGLFAQIHQGVSGARLGPEMPQPYNGCTGDYGDQDAWAKRQLQEAMYPPNPWPGLAVSAVLLVGSVWIVIRRLRVPYKKLRTGTRVA